MLRPLRPLDNHRHFDVAAKVEGKGVSRRIPTSHTAGVGPTGRDARHGRPAVPRMNRLGPFYPVRQRTRMPTHRHCGTDARLAGPVCRRPCGVVNRWPTPS
jgi:hypothetical protein